MIATAAGFGIMVVMRVAQGNRRELSQTLEDLRETAVEASRMLACDVLEDAVVPNRFVWIEWWRDANEVESALGSQRLTMLVAAADHLGSVESVKRIEASEPSELRADRTG